MWNYLQSVLPAVASSARYMKSVKTKNPVVVAVMQRKADGAFDELLVN